MPSELREPWWQWEKPQVGELTDGHSVVRLFTVKLVTPELVGVGGVFTRPDHRGEGRATTLMRQAQAMYPGLVLHANDQVAPFYERLGFRRLHGNLFGWGEIGLRSDPERF